LAGWLAPVMVGAGGWFCLGGGGLVCGLVWLPLLCFLHSKKYFALLVYAMLCLALHFCFAFAHCKLNARQTSQTDPADPPLLKILTLGILSEAK